MSSPIKWHNPILRSHTLLRQLVEFTAEVSLTTHREPMFSLDDLGLLFTVHDAPQRYQFTPINALPFAHTGGDGVHYSLLIRDGILIAEWPIVMTVPMNDPEVANQVVGKNLSEFLCLGYHDGYFAIEQITYDRPAQQMQALQNGEPDRWPTDQFATLQELRARFQLRPWPNVAQRLAELRRDLLPIVELDPDE